MKFKLLIIAFLVSLGIQAQTNNLSGNVIHTKPLISVNDTIAAKLILRRNTDGRDVTASWAYIASVLGGGGGTTPSLQQTIEVDGTASVTVPVQIETTEDISLYGENGLQLGTGNGIKLSIAGDSPMQYQNDITANITENNDLVNKQYSDYGDSQSVINAVDQANNYTNSKDLQAITDVGSTTFNPLISQSFIQAIQFNVLVVIKLPKAVPV